MASIDDLFEFMDAEARKEKAVRPRSVSEKFSEVLSRMDNFANESDKYILDSLFGEGYLDESLAKASRAGEIGLPEKIGAALALAGEGAIRPIARGLSSGGNILGRVGSGFSSVIDDSTLDDSLTPPNTAAAIQTSADYTKSIKDNMAKEAARNIQDNQKILKQLGIGEYISQEASKASPFFVIKGNEPSTEGGSKTKGFSRSNRSIGAKSKEDRDAIALQALESGDFSSMSKALSEAPREDRQTFLALIDRALQQQQKGGGVSEDLVRAKLAAEAYASIPGSYKENQQFSEPILREIFKNILRIDLPANVK